MLSLEKMNRIAEINMGDFVAVVQPGVITEKLQIAVEKQKLFYPPDPASRADSSIGGNIATNAGRSGSGEIWSYARLRAGVGS